jgi:hypothetical protein
LALIQTTGARITSDKQVELARIPFDQMKFPLTLAGGLQAAFADFVSNPLPERLAALLRQLSAERSGDEPNHGASVTTPAVDV